MKPSIPKGTRDFSPVEMNRRNYIFDTIKKVFQKYGYQQIETPSMENLETLTGKYGDEGDKLLFKILNSGPVVDQINKSDADIKLNEISEKGLRYDLTVPFARYVVMHQNEITFPFKRYQIQPVWRADRPQKGRYREFYQCDVDVIGSDSLLNEVELIQIIDEVFCELGLSVTIKINNRKLLEGLCEVIGMKHKFTEVITAIDKFDKIGIEGVWNELKIIGINNQESLNKLHDFSIPSTLDDNLIERLSSFVGSTEIGKLGIREMDSLVNYSFVDYLTNKGLDNKLKIVFEGTLARGLNYYTGTILEVTSNDISIGSLCGGGRYDNLTDIFGLPNVSGVGVSFGVERIYDVLEKKGFLSIPNMNHTQVLINNYFTKDQSIYLDLISKIRAAGINAELFPDPADKGNSNKLQKKQFEYAKSKNIPFTIAIEEINNWKPVVKNVANKTTKILEFENFIEELQLFMDSNK